MSLKAHSLKFKLYLSFSLIILIFLGQLGFMFFQVYKLDGLQHETASRGDDAVEIEQILARVISAYEIIGDSVINRDLEETDKDWKAFHTQAEKDIIRVAELADTGEEEKAAVKFKENYHRYMAVFENDMMSALRAANGETTQEIRAIDGKIDGIRDSVVEPLRFIAKSLKGEQIEADTNYDETSDQVFLIASIITVIGLLLSLFLSRSLVLAITKPLNLVIENLTKASDQIASASDQVASSSQSLASGSSEQAASLEETSSSLEEVSNNSKQNQKASEEARNLSEEANGMVQSSSESMHRMVSAIREIKDSADQTSAIIKTIDEIAFQTNLLALNAAVEAARAGDAGRGFAVVAEEVRNLAQRSAEAAKNTSEMIETSQSRADSGVDLAERVASDLDAVKEAIVKMSGLVSNVSRSSADQTQGVDQVNQAVFQMNSVTQSNAANAEETAAAAEELSAQSQTLLTMVDTLVEVVTGANDSQVTYQGHSNGGSNGGRLKADVKQKARNGGDAFKPLPPPEFGDLDDEDFRD